MSTRDDLYALFKQFFPSFTVIWSDENGPRPQLPYVTLKLSSKRFKNYDFYADPDADGMQEVKGDRELTLTMEYFGVDPLDALQSVVDKLRLHTIQGTFYAAGYTVFDTAQVQDISALLDGVQREQRATLDLFIRTKVTQTDDIGYIETVNIETEDDSPIVPPSGNLIIQL